MTQVDGILTIVRAHNGPSPETPPNSGQSLGRSNYLQQPPGAVELHITSRHQHGQRGQALP